MRIPWLRRHALLWVFVRYVVVVAGLGFMVHSLVGEWPRVRVHLAHMDVGLAATSAALLVLAFALLPLGSERVLRALRHTVSYRHAYRAYFGGQLAKYLPGGLWVVPARAALYAQYDVDGASSTAAAILEMLLLLVSALAVSAPCALWRGDLSAGLVGTVVFLALGVVATLLAPSLAKAPLARVLRLGGRRTASVSISGRSLGALLGLYLGFWALVGLGFSLLVASIEPLSPDVLLSIAPLYAAAWSMGFVSVVAPGGLGIREATLALLLTSLLPSSTAATIPLVSRIWWVSAELVSVLVTIALGVSGRAGCVEHAGHARGQGDNAAVEPSRNRESS